jgi:hypothetical protein
MRIGIKATCRNGHTQTIWSEGLSLEWVKEWAGLMDGTSLFYLKPVGAEEKTTIGHCGVCGSRFTTEIIEDTPPTPPPVDRSARCLADGSPETPDHRELGADGQQKGYIVLTPAERAKGFVRPVRSSYVHVGRMQEFENPDHPSGAVQNWSQRIGGCGKVTTMGRAVAETYARDPGFYNGTFCCACGSHFPLDEFVWQGTEEQVGS